MQTKKVTYNEFYIKRITLKQQMDFVSNKYFEKEIYKLKIYSLSHEPKTLDEFRILNEHTGNKFDEYYNEMISEGFIVENIIDGIKYVGLNRDLKKSDSGNHFDFDANTLFIFNGDDNLIYLEFYNDEEKIIITIDYNLFKNTIKESKLRFCRNLNNKPKNLKVDLV